MFEKIFPIILVSTAILVYFLLIGKGEYFLPSKKMVGHEQQSPVSDFNDLSAAKIDELSTNPISRLTLDSIFKSTHSIDFKGGLPVITLIATGDVIPARSVNYQASIRKDFTWPYKNVAGVLNDGDITFVNLETPLIKDCPITQEGMKFCGNKRNVEGLGFAGVDIVSLANNHSGNYGKLGIEETVNELNKVNIKVTGIKGPEFVLIKGVKFAFLGYNDIEKTLLNSSVDDEVIMNEVSEAKKQADVVVVAFHWGAEYVTAPDERQVALGKLAIDNGADLVIGNHAHWIKPIELYKSRVIAYGHGNFVFDQEWSQKTKEGVVGRYVFLGKELVDVEYLPLQINNYGQPIFLNGDAKQKILDEMYNESIKLR